MKSLVVKQYCHDCGCEFLAQYYANGSIELDDENTCSCTGDWSPVDGPTIYEWLNELSDEDLDD